MMGAPRSTHFKNEGEPVATTPRIRLTGVLIEDSRLLLVQEVLRERSHWNLPGGGLELGETIEAGLLREMREETGLIVRIDELLYITDRFKTLGHHVVDLCFRVCRTGGAFEERQTTDGCGETIPQIRMVPLDQLEAYGLGSTFTTLVRNGFPGKGSYAGDFHALYG